MFLAACGGSGDGPDEPVPDPGAPPASVTPPTDGTPPGDGAPPAMAPGEPPGGSADGDGLAFLGTGGPLAPQLLLGSVSDLDGDGRDELLCFRGYAPGFARPSAGKIVTVEPVDDPGCRQARGRRLGLCRG